jgi:hypothetical protein
LDSTHRAIDVAKVQTSHGIEEHEWSGDVMHMELCIFLGRQRFFTSSKECTNYKLATY